MIPRYMYIARPASDRARLQSRSRPATTDAVTNAGAISWPGAVLRSTLSRRRVLAVSGSLSTNVSARALRAITIAPGTSDCRPSVIDRSAAAFACLTSPPPSSVLLTL